MKDNMTRNEQLTLFDEMSFYEHVEDLINDYESSDLEFKSAAGGFPDNFWETYSAFGNTQGGVIILGVKEHDGIFEPNNLSDEAIDKLQKDFWNGVRNKNTVNICLLQQKDVEVGCSETRTTARTLYPGCVQRYIPQKL